MSFVLSLLLVVAAATIGVAPAPLDEGGSALGTTWRVRVPMPPSDLDGVGLASLVADELARVDAQMSTWRDDSELARFNLAATTGWFRVSGATAFVVEEALAVADLSGGAFDPTVGPLLALWGFGPAPAASIPPDARQLAAVREQVGARQVRVRRDPPALRKRTPGVALDLSAIAKGYGVDAIASRLDAHDVAAYLVEVGGELRGKGAAAGGEPWQVGIETPGDGPRSVIATVRLRDEAIATSGDYRAFVVRDGIRYAHILDPRSGAPVRSALASVSVIAATAARADALATALFVLGPDAGCALAERESIAALFLVESSGAYELRSTIPFDAHRVGPGAGGMRCSS